MSAAADSSSLVINRAKTIAAMGMVERDYEGFSVVSPGLKKQSFRVWRDEEGRVRCNCSEYEERSNEEPRFRCEHILAVKFHLDPPQDAISPVGIESVEPQMEEEPDLAQADESDKAEVLPFADTLKELSHAVSPELVRQRVGWRDRAGREHEVDYVEWHVVADLLDRICPDWSHQVSSIKQIGDFVAVTASITIRGITRQGIGTGSAYDEVGIKKAEHDGLKRAAVKFGIARELYRREEESARQKNGNGNSQPQTRQEFPRDPVAKTMADLVTPKQLVAIRAIANSQGVNAESACMEALKCKPEELSRRAASAFIDYLKTKGADLAEVRHAG